MFELVIFDLDNTLALTDDLEVFRGASNLGNKDQAYKSRLITEIKKKNRRLLSSDFFDDLKDSIPNLKLAVFTKSPRTYACTVLNEVYSDVDWESIVAFEDVKNTKPAPDGIFLAAKACGVTNRESVVIVGDDLGDVEAAYHAGVRVVLAELHGAPPNYEAKKRIPDASVVKQKTLIEAILDIGQKLPVLERLVEGVQADNKFFGRVCRAGHFPPRAVEETKLPLQVISLGRLFTEHKSIRQRREWHKLTNEIVKFKSTDNFPIEWAECIRDTIDEQARSHRMKEGAKNSLKKYKVVITTAPSKKNRPPRMENFLKLIGSVLEELPLSNSTVEVNANMFEFSHEAKSHHGEHLTMIQRYENVRDCLSVTDYADFKNKLVFLIDDVVTTGATLYYMDKYSRANGAEEVFCISLAHTISGARD
ncbi:HAD hydrolase-like protein [Pseudomonas amygdali]|uniref:HAD hydrolase-like protein n=1 Tax=Pseudomonas amygdali TaxID=47877 RepID=UPI001C575B71|nr:HAD hydrolase-like protein [Pseudomonas amygdali]QXW44855.1 HAD hydrolase-like protein [Pseudomonas amygdali]